MFNVYVCNLFSDKNKKNKKQPKKKNSEKPQHDEQITSTLMSFSMAQVFCMAAIDEVSRVSCCILLRFPDSHMDLWIVRIYRSC